MNPIQGIHHITALASDPQANVDFYHNVLGQRLVKTTVNFDDPGTYHLYYGDKVGAPGTILTFFPWPNARRGSPGNGQVGAIAYSIAPTSLDFWQQRLITHGVTVGARHIRFGAEVIPFKDPDGTALELVANDEPTALHSWDKGPVRPEHALRGFHGVTLWVAHPDESAALLTKQLGYRLVGQEKDRWRFRGNGKNVGLYVDLLVRPNLPHGRQGAGSVHHVAFRARNDAEQLEYQRTLSDVGYGVTSVRDRQYFRSIYFREPSGVLFEIATDAPGFTLDEPVEELGQSIKLPPWLEPHRSEIEQALPAITIKPVAAEEEHNKVADYARVHGRQRSPPGTEAGGNGTSLADGTSGYGISTRPRRECQPYSGVGTGALSS